MDIEETNLEGVVVLKNKVFRDERGEFVKTFSMEAFKQLNLPYTFEESFFSLSKKGVLRGMHFQISPMEHSKLVYVSSGKVLDVVVCVDRSNYEFGQVFAKEISEKLGEALLIKPGYAHGFLALSDIAVVNYLTTKGYSPHHDKGIHWNSFGYDWGNGSKIVSERDSKFPSIRDFSV